MVKMLSSILLSLVFLMSGVFANYSEVETPLGMIRGVSTMYTNARSASVAIDVFKGVPYAETLIKSTRFKSAEPKLSWSGVLDTIEFGSSCPQTEPIQAAEPYFGKSTNGGITEDCLTLNIYAPVRANSSEKVPVLVWIHGGGFLTGAGSDYDGGILAAQGDIVIITINYRLGALGFLNIDDSTASGNYGLQDQLLAVKWVNENIGTFGGDTNRITLAGADSGAESITYHMLQEGNEAYFQRAVAFSGVISEDKIVKDADEIAELFAQAVCPQNNSDSVTCLKDLDVKYVLEGPTIGDDGLLAYFGPSADEDDQDTIDNLLTFSQQANNYELLVGVTESDASDYIQYLQYTNKIDTGASKSVFASLVSTIANFYDCCNDLVFTLISNSYNDWFNPLDNVARVKQLTELLTDWFYIKPVTEFTRARTAAQDRATYFVVFDHKTNSSSDETFSGGVNSEMVPYMFGNPFESSLEQYFNEEEQILSRNLMDFVTRFVYFGNPNDPAIDEQWKPYTSEQNYLRMSASGEDQEERYRADKLSVWFSTIPQLQQIQEAAVQEAGMVNVLDVIVTTEEAERIIVALVYTFIALLIGFAVVATVVLAARNRDTVVYDMEGNNQQHDIPEPPIYTPPSTLQKPKAELMSPPVIYDANTTFISNEPTYDNKPTVADMHMEPEPQRPVSFSTFSATDSATTDDQERPDSALAALDNEAYEESP